VVVAFVFTFLIVAVVGLWTWRRQRRSGHRSGYHERWRKVDRDRRRRILRAVRRGEAVEDPRDAALAVEFIDAQQQLARKRTPGSGWMKRVHYLVLALLAVSVAMATPDLRLIGFGLLPLGYLLAIRLFVHRLQGRLASAREKNERLAGRFS
jgi:membrane protein implicated in regulation of membrane protease activity